MTASDSLSTKQVGHLFADHPYGFSVRAFGPDRGELASNGYMVGKAGLGQDLPHAASPEEGAAFMHSREAELRPENRYLGGWIGHEPARTSLDVSQKHPNTFSGHVGAATEAASSNQEAFGHLDAAAEYTEHANPSYDPQGGHALRNVSLRQMGQAVQSAGAAHPSEGIDSPAPSRGSELTAPSRVVR
jgi:hypothetical protein